MKFGNIYKDKVNTSQTLPRPVPKRKRGVTGGNEPKCVHSSIVRNN